MIRSDVMQRLEIWAENIRIFLRQISASLQGWWWSGIWWPLMRKMRVDGEKIIKIKIAEKLTKKERNVENKKKVFFIIRRRRKKELSSCEEENYWFDPFSACVWSRFSSPREKVSSSDAQLIVAHMAITGWLGRSLHNSGSWRQKSSIE